MTHDEPQLRYEALTRELEAIERRIQSETGTRPYLTDESIDAENAGVARDHPEFWARCYSHACAAAGMRAEEEGFDINALIGRNIY